MITVERLAGYRIRLNLTPQFLTELPVAVMSDEIMITIFFLILERKTHASAIG